MTPQERLRSLAGIPNTRLGALGDQDLRSAANYIDELEGKLARALELLRFARGCVSVCADHGVLAGEVRDELEAIDALLAEGKR